MISKDCALPLQNGIPTLRRGATTNKIVVAEFTLQKNSSGEHIFAKDCSFRVYSELKNSEFFHVFLVFFC